MTRVWSVGEFVAASWNELVPTTSGWPLPIETVRLWFSPGMTVALICLFRSMISWSRLSSRSFGGFRPAASVSLPIWSFSWAICFAYVLMLATLAVTCVLTPLRISSRRPFMLWKRAARVSAELMNEPRDDTPAPSPVRFCTAEKKSCSAGDRPDVVSASRLSICWTWDW